MNYIIGHECEKDKFIRRLIVVTLVLIDTQQSIAPHTWPIIQTYTGTLVLGNMILENQLWTRWGTG